MGSDYLFVGRTNKAFSSLQIVYELPDNAKVWEVFFILSVLSETAL